MTTTAAPTGQILADGAPFEARGFNVSNAPIGEGTLAASWADAVACSHDAPMLAQAGVNIVRLWNPSPAPTAQESACLDAFNAAGIGVAITITISAVNQQATAGWLDAQKQLLTAYAASCASHPALMLWLIGNEVELAAAGCVDVACRQAWFGTPGHQGNLEALVAHLRMKDGGNHLVGTTLGSAKLDSLDCYGYMSAANAPSVQFWGMNLYPVGGSASSFCGKGDFWGYIDGLDARPKLVTEFGTDRFRCVPREYHPVQPSDPTQPRAVMTCNGAQSADDAQSESAQAGWLEVAWGSIHSHSGSVSGGIAFMYADPWDKWKTAPCNIANHDVAGKVSDKIEPSPDGVLNDEWWGVAHAQPPGANYRRATTPAFHRLTSLWSGRTPVTVSDPEVTFDATCTMATVGWTTKVGTQDAPSDSEALLATETQGLGGISPLGLLVSNEVFAPVINGYASTPVSRHVMQVPIAPAVPYELLARSTTASGASGVSYPRRFQCG